MGSEEIKNSAKRMIKDLMRYSEDRGIMSALKGGLDEAKESKSWAYTQRWCDLNNDRKRTIVTTIAAMYALHPNHTDNLSFGKSLQILAISKNPDESKENAIESFRKKVEKLLCCDTSVDLCYRLPFIIRMMKSLNIPIDYVELYEGIEFWGKYRKISWAMDYYNVNMEDSNVPNQNNSN